MPAISLRTSVTLDNKVEFLKELSSELARLTGKPEAYVMTSIESGIQMTFGGSSEHSCYVEIKSIGSLNPNQMSDTFCKLIQSRLGISTNRIYISFSDIPANEWGFNCRTFG